MLKAQLHSWQQSLSASTRRDAAWHARADAYWQKAPLKARLQRFGADILVARHVAHDHALGRKLDAVFEHATAARPLMLPPSTTPWTDRAKLAACLVGLAVRQAVDALVCLVGVAVGLVRFALPLPRCEGLTSKAGLKHVQQSIAAALHEQVQSYLTARGEQVTEQFRVDHQRLMLSIGGVACDREGKIEGKMASLRALCDGDSTWARAVSVLTTQFAANCCLDQLWAEGNMRFGSLPVQGWFQRSNVQLEALRQADAVIIRMTCEQALSHLLLGTFSHPEVMLPCDGAVSFELRLRVPRPRLEQTAADVALGFEATHFALKSRIRESTEDLA